MLDCSTEPATTHYYSASDGYEAANQMLRMSPAGITVYRICLLTLSKLCLHFIQQILLWSRTSISKKGWKSLCGQGDLDERGPKDLWKSLFLLILIEMYLLIVIWVIIGRVSNNYRQQGIQIWSTACNTQCVSLHYAVCWKCVLLVSLDYLKMGLAHLLIFCSDLAFSHALF